MISAAAARKRRTESQLIAAGNSAPGGKPSSSGAAQQQQQRSQSAAAPRPQQQQQQSQQQYRQSSSSSSAAAAAAMDSSNRQKLTLPQVIAMTDHRLTSLERSISDIQKMQQQPSSTSSTEHSATKTVVADAEKEQLRRSRVEEMLFCEVADLKDAISKLQRFTMEVVRVLMHQQQPIETIDGDCDGDGDSGDDIVQLAEIESSLQQIMNDTVDAAAVADEKQPLQTAAAAEENEYMATTVETPAPAPAPVSPPPPVLTGGCPVPISVPTTTNKKNKSSLVVQI